MNIRAEYFQARLLVLFQQRRAGKADQHRIRYERGHRIMQFARLRAMAFIHEHEDASLGTEALRQAALDIRQKSVDIVRACLFATTEFLNERTD